MDRYSYAHAQIRIRGGARSCLVNGGGSPKWIDRTRQSQ